MSGRSLPHLRVIETEEARLRVDPSDVQAAIADVLFVDGRQAYRGMPGSRALQGLTYCTVVLVDGFAAVGVAADRDLALRHAMSNAERRLRFMCRRALRLAPPDGVSMPADAPTYFEGNTR